MRKVKERLRSRMKREEEEERKDQSMNEILNSSTPNTREDTMSGVDSKCPQW